MNRERESASGASAKSSAATWATALQCFGPCRSEESATGVSHRLRLRGKLDEGGRTHPRMVVHWTLMRKRDPETDSQFITVITKSSWVLVSGS